MFDTHAHLHFTEAFLDADDVLGRAAEAGITAIVNVGVDPDDSKRAIKFAQRESPVRLYATAGLHPHEASRGDDGLKGIRQLASAVIAIGECGLDYYKNHSTKEEQDRALRMQIELAIEHSLPLIFHVRDAWDDFFAALRDYPTVRGIIHSFTGHQAEVERALAHTGELYFGLNGIMTFTKDDAQLLAAKAVPVERFVLETDCPYLAPVPYRGKRNEPAYVPAIAEFLARLRGETIQELSTNTTANAERIFGIRA